MPLGSGTGTAPGSASRAPWPKGTDDSEVRYQLGRAELGLGNQAGAVAHLRRARELGYPAVFLNSAPELREVRNRI